MKGVLPHTARISDADHLVVGDCDAVELADRFGTPLIVFDRATFEGRAAAYTSALPPQNVFYGGKAFMCVAICQIVEALGLSVDVCSGGELATAAAAGFPPERLLFHGNNKSLDELRAAATAGVGRLVVDSFDEIDRITQLGLHVDVLLRITPGVEAHTHEAIQTGQEDSKFGFGLADGVALEAVKRAMQSECDVVGLHVHLGSQIFEVGVFELTVARLAEFAATARHACGLAVKELNLGGGLGIAYTADETSVAPTEAVRAIIASVEREFSSRGLERPGIMVEPGRSLVGPAGITLYRVGTVKRIPGVRTYVSVDGGMSDNIRPALYGARYEAFLANRASAPPGPRVAIAGKHCESGDVLIKDVHLPDDTSPGDLLCIPATGAYTYSMASNYNRVPRPAVVMVEDGKATEIVRRETYDDLLRLDRHLPKRETAKKSF